MFEVILTQIIVVAFNIYIASTENKKKIYITTFLFNLANLLMYAVNNDLSTAIIYLVITTRSFVYIYKDRLKTAIIPILAIIVQLTVGCIFTEHILHIIPVITPALVCYYMWFCKNTQQLRVWNAICNSLWLIYNTATGLYIVAICRAITVIANIIQYKKHKTLT